MGQFLLSSLLVDGGLSYSSARHVERELDRLRLSGLGADDLASLLLRVLEDRLLKQSIIKDNGLAFWEDWNRAQQGLLFPRATVHH